MNYFRNLGGAFGISLCQMLLARREQVHQAQMTAGLNELTLYSAVDLLTTQLGGRGTALILLQGARNLTPVSDSACDRMTPRR